VRVCVHWTAQNYDITAKKIVSYIGSYCAILSPFKSKPKWCRKKERKEVSKWEGRGREWIERAKVTWLPKGHLQPVTLNSSDEAAEAGKVAELLLAFEVVTDRLYQVVRRAFRIWQ